MKSFILSLTALFVFISIQAQTGEEGVKTTVNRFFTGMKNVDTAMIRSTLAPGVLLQSVQTKKDGTITIINEDMNDFLGFIVRETAGNLDEQIQFEPIKIDGSLASAWTPYKFFYKGKFLHCGANSFQLVKLNGDWKIQYIIDTRRKEGCE